MCSDLLTSSHPEVFLRERGGEKKREKEGGKKERNSEKETDREGGG